MSNQDPQPAEPEPSASSAWRDLVSGRSFVTAHYELDGRRFLVTKPHVAPLPKPLTPRQHLALAMRARGAYMKEIAFDLEISLAMVSVELGAVMKQLGLRSSADLAKVFGHVAD